MKSVVIVGSGGFGREVLEIFKAQNELRPTWDILGFIDEDKGLNNSIINNYRVLGGLDWLAEHNNINLGCVVAIGDCRTRKVVVEILEEMGISFYNAIHPSVLMSDSVELGRGVIICAGSVLTVNIKIGSHVQVNLNCTVGHDAVIGSYCTVSPMVAVNGHDHLGEGVYIGSGVTLIQDVSVGGWSTIGAGAVVVKDIPEKVLAVGIPARVIKSYA